MQRCRDAKGWTYRILLPLWGQRVQGMQCTVQLHRTDGECWVYMVHREAPPHGWWVLVVIVARGIPLEECCEYIQG